MPVLSWFFASGILSSRNSGWRTSSTQVAKTSSKLSLRQSQDAKRRVEPAAGLDARAARLEVVVELVAGARLRPARAPDLAVDAHEPDLGRGLLARAAADARRAADERQLVVLLQEDHEAVRERDPLRLLRREGPQRRLLDLAPVRRLAGGERGDEERPRGKDDERRSARHRWPPLSRAVAICVDWIIATVRFVSTNVSFATRRTSAFVTFWIWSTSRNSSRQSPSRAWYRPSWSGQALVAVELPDQVGARPRLDHRELGVRDVLGLEPLDLGPDRGLDLLGRVAGRRHAEEGEEAGILHAREAAEAGGGRGDLLVAHERAVEARGAPAREQVLEHVVDGVVGIVEGRPVVALDVEGLRLVLDHDLALGVLRRLAGAQRRRLRDGRQAAEVPLHEREHLGRLHVAHERHRHVRRGRSSGRGTRPRRWRRTS